MAEQADLRFIGPTEKYLENITLKTCYILLHLILRLEARLAKLNSILWLRKYSQGASFYL